ncbi:GNAT family N-acetyltransferase [Chitiniphilus eburneus]|uniref:GNAT family N-acetyltransferase n=1 Tax=Chitiniphilus eburneus TaxID=2571148 RepID=A0A4V5MQL8_9NEIS|nr:GNAT family protein [Chitiniphilus eburneus]TJZ70108.1 GNAT family N-acetyltransferase [Chitiniphilus eburneus]
MPQLDPQPLGPYLPDWCPPPAPPHIPLHGHGCRLEPVDAARHADALFAAFAEDTSQRAWTYLPYGPFADATALAAWLNGKRGLRDQQLYAIVDTADGAALGLCGYLRIQPEAGSIEVGNLTYSPRLQRSRLATAAMALMMENAFALGYRRYEWKCNALNAPSRRAAERLGFTFEGIFRQALVVKGHNRDTAWYSILDREWPRLRDAYARWLSPENFDPAGRQRQPLSAFMEAGE